MMMGEETFDIFSVTPCENEKKIKTNLNQYGKKSKPFFSNFSNNEKY